ncbi:unnamed protein product [Anisakis simplex]|uniref:Secreted protein n=1 Tax=Anisakis simplex TaxID=6269 RepID=A0A0M3KAL5_ANISI|nr:unnamed protein product [Anisakis simplex]
MMYYFKWPALILIFGFAGQYASADQEIIPAVRVVRFQVDYPNAQLSNIKKYMKWNAIMRNSVLASLRFVNKHWLICGGSQSEKLVLLLICVNFRSCD